ncbi:hypothetical protein A4X09_0g2819 [Tilletia walkeri]|uniref:FAD-binding domain-containing protein n=1 Tax=Tilletia walkeri TaxID=117179 RepID=A0A8X7T663_9BASI|nr:hypothetical protein A4X09_0g2819 [Tilletia walkeri]
MERIAVVGAGPVGSLAAIALAERGCKVDLYERQPLRSSTTATPSAGNTRSINLAISTRALTALASLTPSSQEETLADLVLVNGIPMRARMIHHMPQAVSNAQASSSSKAAAAAAAGLDLRESGSVYVKLLPSVQKEHPRTRPEIQRGDSVAAFDSIAPSPSSSTDINQPQASTSPSPQDLAEIKLDSQDYGIDPLSHQIHSVDRSRLSQLLLARAEAHPAIRVRWGCVLQDVHFEQDGVELEFEHTTSGLEEEKKEIIKERADMVIGCDGMHSVVRRSLNNYQPLDVSQTYIDSAYLELHIPAPRSTEEGGWPLSPNHLHIWPRNSFMLIALPNSDRSFTCTLFAPYVMFGSTPPPSTKTNSNHPLAGALSEPSSALSLFRTYFPDALSLLGEDHLLQAIQARASRPGRLGSVLIQSGEYHERSGGRAVLLGDAAHAMVPFYGQGLNCGLEDVRVLIETLESEGVLPRRGAKGQERSRVAHALGVYSRKRHPALCAILRLAQQNYEEMSHRVVSRTYLARRWIDGVLMRLLAPGRGTVTVVGDGKDRRVVNNTTTIIDLSLSLLRSFTSSSKLSTFPPTPTTPNKPTTRTTTTTAPSERALGAWKSLYTMVTFTNMPYDAVLAQAKRQDRIVSFASAGLVGVGAVGLAVGVWGVWR